MVVLLIYGSLLLSMAAVGLLGFVAWKARRAHRSLWSVLEGDRKRHAEERQEACRQWQLCYGRLIALERGLDAPLKLTAQTAEDVFLLDYFCDQKDGVYVDVGAYDGVALSNTYALSQLGWHGLLVEANAVNAERCRQNRPADTTEHCAIGGRDAAGVVTFTVVDGAGGVDTLSFVNADEGHIARCAAEGGILRKVEVPLSSIEHLLRKHNISKIDLLSLDIEGGEITALEGLNFEMVRPRLIVAEANDRVAEEELVAFLQFRNYRLICHRGMNLFFESKLLV